MPLQPHMIYNSDISCWKIVMRALIDIKEEQIRDLDRLAKEKNTSRAAIIREALHDYLRENERSTSLNAFGLWGECGIDGLAYQEKIRGEW